METPRVYADFNSIEYLDIERTQAILHLTSYGTISSLSNQKLRLAEGMAIVAYEPDDVEADATAHFDTTHKDPAGREGAWVARLDPQQIRDCENGPDFPDGHACYGCGNDLIPHLRAVGQHYVEVCLGCGTSVMAPLAPPPNST